MSGLPVVGAVREPPRLPRVTAGARLALDAQLWPEPTRFRPCDAIAACRTKERGAETSRPRPWASARSRGRRGRVAACRLAAREAVPQAAVVVEVVGAADVHGLVAIGDVVGGVEAMVAPAPVPMREALAEEEPMPVEAVVPDVLA